MMLNIELVVDGVVDGQKPLHRSRRLEPAGETFDPDQPETDELNLTVLKLAKRWKPKKPRK